MPRGESLYHAHPNYRVDLTGNPEHLRVSCHGVVVAESCQTLIVRETRHDPVLYFPTEDVRFDLMEKTGHETFCPFKGEASYWSIHTDEGSERNVVWGYEDPFPEVADLARYVAFYTERVEIQRVDA